VEETERGNGWWKMPSHNTKVFVKRLPSKGGRINAMGKSRTRLRPGQNPPRTTCFMASYIFACRGKKGETPPPPESDKKTL